MTEIPSLFVSHGPPLIALVDCPAKNFFENLGRHFPEPKGIICISAHWEAVFPKVTGAPKSGIIYDFGGPPHLFGYKYDAPGAPALADRVAQSLQSNGFDAAVDGDRGIDHGVWIPMLLMYPEAQIPVIQLSVQTDRDSEYHYRMGNALKTFRNDDILIVGSGGAVHNLDDVYNYKINSTPPDYVVRFDRWLEEKIEVGDTEALLNWKKRAPNPEKSHPFPAEHFLPLFVAMGAAEEPNGRKLHGSFMFGALSMAAYMWA